MVDPAGTQKPSGHGTPGVPRALPAWRRATEAEARWPVTLVVAALIGLQLMVPQRLSMGPDGAVGGRWLLPAIELLIAGMLFASDPRRVTARTPALRTLGLVLLAVASLANAWSVVRLVKGLVAGTEGGTAGLLLAVGGNVWITNVIIFGLWYWELDRGGPAARAHGVHHHPDFFFPQMSTPDMARKDWEPKLVDYLYLAFTNATAFSPTDTLPFSRWSKGAMALQSSISLVTGALVVARAVNILH
jgi:uncharacterized membrane protein